MAWSTTRSSAFGATIFTAEISVMAPRAPTSSIFHAAPADDVLVRHPHGVKVHLAVTVRLVVFAEHGEHPHDLDARSIERHEHHRVLVVPILRRILGAPHEDGHLGFRMSDAARPPLLA